ncbi:hypothetical protein AB9E28_00235 [Rhizobium leguminosarum]|uniref:hypothetical protein n=1 Tax=Rhizobium leguminosarum TaxID=384 RepID=UPI003F954DCF
MANFYAGSGWFIMLAVSVGIALWSGKMLWPGTVGVVFREFDRFNPSHRIDYEAPKRKMTVGELLASGFLFIFFIASAVGIYYGAKNLWPYIYTPSKVDF